jgi:polysaccharide biosynthesis/export protein
MLIGCASGRSGTDPRNLTIDDARSDSVGTAVINRRIEEAAAERPVELRVESDSEYLIGPDDRIDVSVFGAEAFSGEHRVDGNGQVAIPLLGPVMAGGKTLRELETHLEDRLRQTYMRDPHVAVQVVEMRSQGVSVVGAVREPGVYQLTRPSTLLEVLAVAGGLTEEAGSSVFVMRPTTGPQPLAEVGSAPVLAASTATAGQPGVIEVDLGALLDSGDTSQNLLVRAGDIVQVRPAGLVYVVGEVNRPGGFSIPPGQPMTVLQALAMAEGLGSTAAASRGVIVRDGTDGSRQEIPVDIDKVLDGSEEPAVLHARDVLFVPNNTAKSVALGAVNALVRMVTLRGLFY